MAILTPDQRKCDQLAYACLVIREAQRHGGCGWLDYDWAFGHSGNRQQLTNREDGTPWSQDYRLQQCSVKQAHNQPFVRSAMERITAARPLCAVSYIYPLPLCPPPQQRQASNRPSQGVKICKSWNKGACIFPGRCWFRHVCTKCQLPHKAKDCPTTLDQRPQVRLTRPQPGAQASPRP